MHIFFVFFFSSRRRHTISLCDWSSDVCSSDLRFVDPVEDFASLFLENFDNAVKVLDTVVDHKGGLALSEVVAFHRTDRPDSGPSGRFALRIAPGEGCASPFLNVDPEVTLVPGLQGRRVFGFEEDAAYASDSLHFDLQCRGA